MTITKNNNKGNNNEATQSGRIEQQLFDSDGNDIIYNNKQQENLINDDAISESEDSHVEDLADPYLALREEKIKQNEQRLKKLGLLKMERPKKKKLSVKPKMLQRPAKRSARIVSLESCATMTSSTTTTLDSKNKSNIDNYKCDNIDINTNNMDSTAVDPILSNPYLALREARIQRNQQRLKELGLLDMQQPKKVISRPKPVTKPTRFPRRSLRINSELSQSTMRTERYQKIIRSRSTKNSKSIIATTAKPSVKLISINPQILMQNVLGKELSQPGKAHVLVTSIQLASPEGRNNVNPQNISFNKYSGVQNFANKVLYLWVNLGEDSNNTFSLSPCQNNCHISWYGGGRMHNGTPIIHELLDITKRQAAEMDNNVDSSFGVFLWCRTTQPPGKVGFRPYTCLGRLAYVSHDESVFPLSFVFRLVDYSTMMQSSDKSMRAHVESLIAA